MNPFKSVFILNINNILQYNKKAEGIKWWLQQETVPAVVIYTNVAEFQWSLAKPMHSDVVLLWLLLQNDLQITANEKVIQINIVYLVTILLRVFCVWKGDREDSAVGYRVFKWKWNRFWLLFIKKFTDIYTHNVKIIFRNHMWTIKNL